MKQSETFILGNSNHNLQPVTINTAEDETHFWKWDSDSKGYIRKSIKPNVKVLIKNDTYFYGGRTPKWIEGVTIKKLKNSEIYMVRITDPLTDGYNQIAFRKTEHIKIRVNQ